MKELGHLKLIHFFLSASLGAIIPYLPLVFILHGISFLKSGLLLSLPPFIGLFTRPLLMSLVEKFGVFKPSLVGCVILNSFILLLLQSFHSSAVCSYLPSISTRKANPDIIENVACFVANQSNYSCSFSKTKRFHQQFSNSLTPESKNGLVCCSKLPFGEIFESHNECRLLSEIPLEQYFFGTSTQKEYCMGCDVIQDKDGNHVTSELLNDIRNSSCQRGRRLHPGTMCDEHSPFATYTIFMVTYSVYSCIIIPVLDALSTQFCRNLPDVDHNMQKLWGTAGFGFAAFLSSVLLSLTSYIKSMSLSQSFVLFIPFMLFSLISLILTILFKFAQPTPSAQLLFGLSALLQSAESVVFLIVMTIFGCLAGTHSVFFVLYLLQIDACYLFIGIAFGIYTALDLILYFTRRELVFYIGCRAVIYLALVAYAVRFYAFSIVSNAVIVLPIELLHAVCFSAMWFASMDFASQIAPMGLSSAFQGLLTNAYWHVGFCLGAIVGGVLYEKYGYEVMWQSAAAVSLLCAILFAVFNHFLHPWIMDRGCVNNKVPADTQDFFDDDLDDLLDDDVIQFQNFTSDEEYLILDAPGDYSIVTSKGEQFVTPQKDATGESIAAANRGQLKFVAPSSAKKLNNDHFTIEDINV